MAMAAAALLLATAAATAASPAASVHPRCRADWPMYGHDLEHTFSVAAGCSQIGPSNVATLVPAWFFHTKDSITASPAPPA